MQDGGSLVVDFGTAAREQMASLKSIEIDERKVDGVVVGRTTKIKLWDKNRALEMAMKHLGLYGADNVQRPESLALQIVLVKPGDI